jgi:hypothetical protein
MYRRLSLLVYTTAYPIIYIPHHIRMASRGIASPTQALNHADVSSCFSGKSQQNNAF